MDFTYLATLINGLFFNPNVASSLQTRDLLPILIIHAWNLWFREKDIYDVV